MSMGAIHRPVCPIALPARSPGPGGRARSRGLSLLELLVALAVGGLVVGALLLTYLGSGTSARQMRALGQMTEDAQFVLALMGRDIRMAGFTQASGIQPAAGGQPARFQRLQSFRPVFGCDWGFATTPTTFAMADCDAAPPTPPAPPPGAPPPPAPSPNHVIEVNLQVTRDTTIPPSQGGSDPVDCLGQAAVASTLPNMPPNTNIYFVSNRYSIRKRAGSQVPELYCESDLAGASRQPLVENVADMRLAYGVSDASSAATPSRRPPVRYVTASDVTSADWNHVVAVRVCIVMRSADEVIPAGEVVDYTGCDGATVTPGDRRMYRAYHATVAIRSRAGW